jgi:hypothetical protein
MVSIEGMIGGRGTVSGQHCRTLVLNTLNGNRALTHIAIIAQAIPTLIRVSIENLEPSKLKGDLGSLIRLSVNLHSGLALIPDLDELERQIFKVIEQPSG